MPPHPVLAMFKIKDSPFTSLLESHKFKEVAPERPEWCAWATLVPQGRHVQRYSRGYPQVGAEGWSQEGGGAQVGRAGGGASAVPGSGSSLGRRPPGIESGCMWGRAVRRRCPRGLRRGREVLLVLLVLAGLGAVLRARSGSGMVETRVGPVDPGLPRTPRPGRREPVLQRPSLAADALGAQGEAVRLQLQGKELQLQEESVRLHQINIYLSDRISLHRRLPERWNPL